MNNLKETENDKETAYKKLTKRMINLNWYYENPQTGYRTGNLTSSEEPIQTVLRRLETTLKTYNESIVFMEIGRITYDETYDKLIIPNLDSSLECSHTKEETTPTPTKIRLTPRQKNENWTLDTLKRMLEKKQVRFEIAAIRATSRLIAAI